MSLSAAARVAILRGSIVVNLLATGIGVYESLSERRYGQAGFRGFLGIVGLSLQAYGLAQSMGQRGVLDGIVIGRQRLEVLMDAVKQQLFSTVLKPIETSIVAQIATREPQGLYGIILQRLSGGNTIVIRRVFELP